MATAAAGLVDRGNPAAIRRLQAGDDPLGGANVDDVIAPVLRRRRGRGQPLPNAMGDSMGAQLGIDTSSVRVHHDAEAGSVARSIQATAFTHGNDIYFAPGAYRPSSQQGQRVLAHELSHVAAQRSGVDRAGGASGSGAGSGAGGSLTVGRADDPAEAAADRSADRVLTALRRTPAASGTVVQPDTRPVPPELRRSFTGSAPTGTIRREPGGAPAAPPKSRRQRRAAARAAAAPIGAAPAESPAAPSSGAAPAQTPAEAPVAAEVPAEAPATPPMNRRQRRAAQKAAGAPATAQTAPAQGGTTPETATPEPTAEERWARALAGGDEAKATALLQLRTADASMVPWLDAQAETWPMVAYAAAHRAELGTPFDPARFDLFYGRQAMVPAMLSLLTRAAEPWSTANIKSVLAKTGGAPDTESKYLSACVTCSLTATQALALATSCDAKVLTGLGDSAELQAELTRVKQKWTDFSKIARLFTAFHKKQPDFALLARLVAACVKHTWAQDDVKKLVDGLKAAPLKEVAETEDLQNKIQDVIGKWKDWGQLAEVIDTGHDKNMTAADKAGLLAECAAQQQGKKYTAVAAKRYIEVASTASGYTWAQRLTQVELFRNHVQPAGLTNDLGGGTTPLGSYQIPANAANGDPKCTAEIGLPENKRIHVMDGHSYERYCFTMENIHRSPYSSMLAPGTNVTDKVRTAVAAGLTPQIQNAARNRPHGPGGTQDRRSNYVVAYRHSGTITRYLSAKPGIPAGPGQRARRALPERPGVYGVAVSQFYPDGGWMHHKLASNLAEAIGHLRGYIS